MFPFGSIDSDHSSKAVMKVCWPTRTSSRYFFSLSPMFRNNHPFQSCLFGTKRFHKLVVTTFMGNSRKNDQRNKLLGVFDKKS